MPFELSNFREITPSELGELKFGEVQIFSPSFRSHRGREIVSLTEDEYRQCLNEALKFLNDQETYPEVASMILLILEHEGNLEGINAILKYANTTQIIKFGDQLTRFWNQLISDFLTQRDSIRRGNFWIYGNSTKADFIRVNLAAGRMYTRISRRTLKEVVKKDLSHSIELLNLDLYAVLEKRDFDAELSVAAQEYIRTQVERYKDNYAVIMALNEMATLFIDNFRNERIPYPVKKKDSLLGWMIWLRAETDSILRNSPLTDDQDPQES